MEQAELEQFLDTGRMNGADLFFRGRIYRTERCVDEAGTGSTTVFSWHAKKVSEKEYDDDFRIGAYLNYSGCIGTIFNSERRSHNVAFGPPNETKNRIHLCR